MAWTDVTPTVIPIHQPNPSTCWLACLQMLYVWRGKTADQVLTDLNNDPDVFPDEWLSSGISPENCLTIARSLKLGCAGDGDADSDVLANALKMHGPYWVVGEWKSGSPHVKVVVGCDPAAQMVKLINPWNPIDDTDFASIDKFNNRGARWKVFGSFMYWS
ncbi:MAG TPA: papain-like cysteine protease family protein [Pyrinomonadaceae bacterium]|jgi:Papain-like cysteine protease AvrRpt2|nr:papain-like cysteine protease family protein [Pyrinomonadaceae bacterium]